MNAGASFCLNLTTGCKTGLPRVPVWRIASPESALFIQRFDCDAKCQAFCGASHSKQPTSFPPMRALFPLSSCLPAPHFPSPVRAQPCPWACCLLPPPCPVSLRRGTGRARVGSRLNPGGPGLLTAEWINTGLDWVVCLFI